MFKIRKKILVTFLVFGGMLFTACGGKGKAESGTANGKGAAAEEVPVMEGDIEVTEDLPDRDIMVPEYLVGENEENLKEKKINEENPGTPDHIENGEEPVYHMSGEDQAEMARQVAAQIEDSINQVLADKEHYPNVTGISVNPGCTEFNVTFSSRELSLYENVLHMSLCIVGDRFQLYQGKREDELMTVVDYTDAGTGEIFYTINSREIE